MLLLKMRHSQNTKYDFNQPRKINTLTNKQVIWHQCQALWH